VIAVFVRQTMPGRRRPSDEGRARRMARVLLVAASVALLGAALAPASWAAFGDDYGILEINDGPGPREEAPAIPGTNAFWAGTCDLFAAPPAGQPIAGGVGTRPPTVLAGTSLPPAGPNLVQDMIAAPSTVDHCVDYGAQTMYPFQANTWQTIPFSFPNPQNPAVQLAQSTHPGDYAPSWRLPALTQAGGRPDGTTMFAWTRNTEGVGTTPSRVDGGVDNIVVDLPPGFFANPTATPKCPTEKFDVDPMLCPPETQVGILRLNIEGVTGGGSNIFPIAWDTTYPVYNLVPRAGRPAEIGFAHASGEPVVNVRLEGKARTNGDFGITAFVGQVPAALSPIAQAITIWGVPWAASNDVWRAKTALFEDFACKAVPALPFTNNYIPPNGLAPGCNASYDPTWGPIKPFIANPTECDGKEPTVTLRTDSYQNPDPADPDWKTYTSASPPVTGCDKVPFDATAVFAPTSAAADSASGLNVDIGIPQNNDPPASVATNPSDTTGAPAFWKSDAGLATAHLDKTVVTLPEGMTVNPSGAAGLEACSDGTMGVRQLGNPPLFTNTDPTDGLGGDDCPDGSKIGTVEATTPLLEEKLTGDFVLGEPKSTDPQSGEMFRVFLVLRNKARGLVAKVYGTSVADPNTGRLTATFDKNPRVPVDNIKVAIKGGDRGLFAMPQDCGERSTNAVFTPWTAANNGGGVAKATSSGFTVGGDCALGFAPGQQAGMSTSTAKQNGTFSFKFSRNDGEQWFKSLVVGLPEGLLASVKGFVGPGLCSSAQADAGACPEASRIGSADATAGTGNPFVLEKKGDVYLTEGYKGGPFGLMVRVPVEAGPFRGDKALTPIVVRQAIYVNKTTAAVSVVSDPLPEIWHGIPVRVRSVTVNVDRPAFMVNPTSCVQKQVGGFYLGTRGAGAFAASAFRATGCGGLPLKPNLYMNLTAKKIKELRDGGHPGLSTVLTQAPGESNLRRVQARLPLSLALDPDNAQELCKFVDGQKEACGPKSVVGTAKAFSPLLNRPLTAPVYFVENQRIDPKTKRVIKTLPTLLIPLKGEIAVTVRGTSDVIRGKLVNTFDLLPDAQISRFELDINGGKNGILTVTLDRDACKGKQVTFMDVDGQNGRQFDPQVTMKTPCKKLLKAEKKKAKAKARRKAAAKRKAGAKRRTPKLAWLG
jgi:hypothetical protein